MTIPFNGADAMVRMLQLNGVKHIFGLCGDTSLPFYDALARLDHGITHKHWNDPAPVKVTATDDADATTRGEPPIAPRTFSINTPYGACPECQGLGIQKEIDPDLVVPNKELTLTDGAITGWPTEDKAGYYWQLLKATAKHFDIPLDVPVRQLSQQQMRILLYGSGNESIDVRYRNREGATRNYGTKYEGVIPNLWRRCHPHQGA